MVRDNFDKLAEGVKFDTRRASKTTGKGIVKARVKFDTDELEYVVKLVWSGVDAKHTYAHKRKALERYEELCEEHGLD